MDVSAHSKHNFQSLLANYGTAFALIVLFLFFSFAATGFLNGENLLNILRQISLLTIISEGFTMCLIVGELDLSFASVANLSGIVTAELLFGTLHPLLAVLLGISIGFAFGIGNGLLVTMLGIPSLIVTLASGVIATGLVYAFTKGVALYGRFPKYFLILGRGTIGSIPLLIIFMLIIVIFALIFIQKTKPGRYMEAVGGNSVAARLAGINVNFYRTLGLTLSGIGAAVTGILLTSRLGSANPEGASGFLMDGFATGLLGMTVFRGGRANVLGTFVGALFIGILNNGMTLLGAPYYMQDIAKGIIIILAVAIASLQALKLSKV